MSCTIDYKPLLPKALEPGDTLGIVAPASPFNRRSFDAGVRVLESMGFHLIVHGDTFQRKGFLAGSDQLRAKLLSRLFSDPDVDGIICARGGYGALRILPLLNKHLIEKNPKVFVGFSDITVLLAFLMEQCHMVCFHGPTVTTLGNNDDWTRDQFLTALTRPVPLSLSASATHVIRPGSATGRFFSGNLTLLCHLTGTGYQPDLRGCILMVEDQGEAPYRIDRMLTQMRLAGCFKDLAGLALGTFTNCGGSEALDAIFADRLNGLDIPILAGFDVGHTDTNLTVPVGLNARLDTESGTLAFTGPAIQ